MLITNINKQNTDKEYFIKYFFLCRISSIFMIIKMYNPLIKSIYMAFCKWLEVSILVRLRTM